ncbi:iron ABC transporter permease [Cellulomonas sp. PhB143]|uniref:FecCD family ABC transporter permease n=1 Tax=Cellulomonas sp. PhB143 TaxID=2485186 RepID=UPI000F46F822|nr:iron chelate uptake ABC transporter family permease subunit [Cellulomonas sp. PhB143]ROS75560.1 iron complex transport system permease protein [Cellulomonas sp. PhB143]
MTTTAPATRPGPESPVRTPGAAARRRRRLAAGLVVCVVVLVAAVAASLALGARPVPLDDVWSSLWHPVPGNADDTAVHDLRLPRTVVGALAGLLLAFGGTVIQGVTRNPLGDPGLLGIQHGSSLAVVLAIALLGVTDPGGYVWFAFAGAAFAVAVVYGVAGTGRGGATPVKLALAGAAFAAAMTSLITLVLLMDPSTLDQYRFWSVGSLAGRSMDVVRPVLPFAIVGVVLTVAVARTLDLLALGDDLARGLGQHLVRARVLSAVAVVLLCGSATALAGPLVFVGLVVPHLARRFTGPDHRWLLAYAAFLGPALVLVADVVGRLVLRPAELQVGIVVSVLGAPLLIAIVRRKGVAGL